MARVTLRQLSKRYGNVVALQPLDLEIEHGEFVSLLGPSGSGKSTVLKLIAGIEEASGGSVLFDGRDVTQVPPERRDVAMVFQSYALYPTMSVYDNIAFPLRLRRVPKGEIDRRVRETAELLSISHVLERRPRQLSGGERQRVAVGRAIVRQPQVFLLDEPLSNLDAHLRAGMRQELKHLHRVLGTTFIYVTHDQDDAIDLGSRVAVLAGGTLQQFASSADIYRAPANRFVASFVGHPPMNLIHGRIVRAGGDAIFEAPALPLELGKRSPDGVVGEVVVGLRPEAITVAPGRSRAPHGVVEGVSALGFGRLYATVRVGGTALTARVPELNAPPEIGAVVGLEVDLSAVHFFDVKSGRRLPSADPKRNGS
jgi:multiple sugar transport system ATP-binding protein